MSYEASSWAAALTEMNSGMKLALMVIANHASASGVSFVGRARLAEEACCRPETITANLRKLEDDGLLRRYERRRPNGSRTSDWIVLAPHRVDRGPMKDALPDEDGDTPANVREAATAKSSGEESQGELFAGGQVRNPGGPEPSGDRTAPSSSATARQATEEATDAMIALTELPTNYQVDAHELLKARVKVGTRLVTPAEMVVAAWIVRTFNDEARADAGLGANLTPIVGRVRERPSWTVADHVRLIESAFRLKWWEKKGNRRRPTPAVIYGNPQVFEQVIADAADEKAGREAPATTRRFERKGPRRAI